MQCCADDAARARRYIPFAEGPRNCVGQSLAQTTLPITLAALLSHFTFRLADQVPLAPPPAPFSCCAPKDENRSAAYSRRWEGLRVCEHGSHTPLLSALPKACG